MPCVVVRDTVVELNQKGLLAFDRAAVHLEGTKFEANVEAQVEMLG